MPNMPTITPVEIAVVTGAVLLLHVAPFILTLVEGYQRRKLEPPARPELFPRGEALTEVQPAASPDTASPGEGSPSPLIAPGSSQPETMGEPELPARSSPVDIPSITVEPVSSEAPPAPNHHAGYVPGSATASAGNGHRFRLEDLHRARLADWPPASVRDDPQQRQLWSEAERLFQQHRGTLLSTLLSAPFPVRSACLGGIVQQGAIASLYFLLFPDLWPVTPDQAIAHAIFDIDPSRSDVCGRVEIVTPSAI